jgi:hypothetical protein
MAARRGPQPPACRCDVSAAQLVAEAAAEAAAKGEDDSAVTGCEAPATLTHGSLIRIGCLQFVFSTVTDVGDKTEQQKAPDELDQVKSEEGPSQLEKSS